MWLEKNAQSVFFAFGNSNIALFVMQTNKFHPPLPHTHSLVCVVFYSRPKHLPFFALSLLKRRIVAQIP